MQWQIEGYLENKDAWLWVVNDDDEVIPLAYVLNPLEGERVRITVEELDTP